MDADQAMDAQAHMMRDLLRDFGDVPLALVAYNAGRAPVRACGCVRRAGDSRGARLRGQHPRRAQRPANPLSTGATGLEVRLVR